MKITKVLSITLISVLLSSTSFAFSDLQGHWAENYIKSLKTADIIEDDNGSFEPDSFLNKTIAEKYISSAFGETDYENTLFNEDYITKSQFHSAINDPYAVNNSDEKITKAEAASMIFRTVNYNNPGKLVDWDIIPIIKNVEYGPPIDFSGGISGNDKACNHSDKKILGHKKSKIYHRYGEDSSYNTILVKNAVMFDSEAHAEYNGFRPAEN